MPKQRKKKPRVWPKYLLAYILGVLTGVGALVLTGWLYFKHMTSDYAGKFEAGEKALGDSEVKFGTGRFQVRTVAEDLPVGLITDMKMAIPSKPDSPEVSVAGVKGSIVIDKSGDKRSKSYSFASRENRQSGRIGHVLLGPDGPWGFYEQGYGWSYPATLFDSTGQALWSFKSESAVNSVAGGDLNGDGIPEFVVGYNGGGGVDLFDHLGNKVWHQSGGNIWRVVMVDVAGDKLPEIVHSDAAGKINIRDSRGTLLSSNKPDQYFSHFALGTWPPGSAKPAFFIADVGHVYAYDSSAALVQKLDVPELTKRGAKLVTADLGWGIAISATPHLSKRSLLLIFDTDGKLVYSEALSGLCKAFFAWPPEDGKAGSFWLGSHNSLQEYTLQE